MNKKPAARFIQGMCAGNAPHHHLLHNPYGIGYERGLQEELMQPVEIEFGSYTGHSFLQDNKILDELQNKMMSQMVHRQVSGAVDRGLQSGIPVAATVEHDWDSSTMNMSMSIQHWMDVIRQTKVEETTCRVPPELYERFMAEGFTEDEVKRMVIYPERCQLTVPDVEIVYKLDPAQDGVS